MFKHASIGKKLFGAFLTLTVISFLIGYLSYRNLERNSEVFDTIILGTTPRIQALLEMKNISNQIGDNAIRIQTIHTGEIVEEGMRPSDSKSLILANLEKLLRWTEDYRRASADGVESAAQEEFLSTINESKSAIILATLDYIDAREHTADIPTIELKESILTEEIEELKELIGSAIATETEGLRIQKQNADASMENTLVTIVGMSTVSVCFALLAWLLLVRMIVKPLRYLRNVTHAVAGGNMENTITIHTKDEIGDLAKAFNNMISQLREFHKVMRESNDELENIKKELEGKLGETERMNQHMINRELKMIELKREIAELKERVETVV